MEPSVLEVTFAATKQRAPMLPSRSADVTPPETSLLDTSAELFAVIVASSEISTHDPALLGMHIIIAPLIVP
jgi:hypothetical protein